MNKHDENINLKNLESINIQNSNAQLFNRFLYGFVNCLTTEKTILHHKPLKVTVQTCVYSRKLFPDLNQVVKQTRVQSFGKSVARVTRLLSV